MTVSTTDMGFDLTLEDGPRLHCAVGQAHSEALSRLADLTPKQRQVFSLLSFGFSNKEIAAMMGVAESTIKAHMCGVFRVYGCFNRCQAALIAFAIRRNIDPSGIARPTRSVSHEDAVTLSSLFEGLGRPRKNKWPHL